MKITIFENVIPHPTREQKSTEAPKAKQGKEYTPEDRDDFINTISSFAWSPSLFIDNDRVAKNFLQTDLLVLDIYSGMTLKEADEIFIILPPSPCFIILSANI